MESFEIGSVTAVINKVQTTADGGARITLDLASHDSQVISKLLSHKMNTDGLIQVGIIGVLE